MKILHFGNSQDFVNIEAENSLPNLMTRKLEAALGEPVQVVVKRAWPTERLPGLFTQWMEEEEPDVVVMRTVSYWFMYPSVPLKLSRRFGWLGLRLGEVGLRMADTAWLAHNRVFRAGRKLATRLIGGETHFTPDEVVDVISACMREAVRHEGVVVVVLGPGASVPYGDHSKKALAELEARRQYVTHRMAEVCQQHRVHFRGFERPVWQTGELADPVRDGLHRGREGNVDLAELYAGEVVAAVGARGTG